VIREQTTRSPAGAIIFDARWAEQLGGEADARWFDPEHWRAGAGLEPTRGGRGASWFVGAGAARFVLRHYRRGGLLGAVLDDRYLDLGLERSRPWREFKLTAALHERGLPVPRPVAARVWRSGLVYRGDLITVRLDATPLASAVGQGAPQAAAWRAAGACIATLHAAGLDHADLNLHNLLLDAGGKATLIDLDRGVLRAPGAWRAANLARLERSLTKLGAGRWDAATQALAWRELVAGYGGVLSGS
jgi:3-deoxy-D-manno-octulosonic acid kinase